MPDKELHPLTFSQREGHVDLPDAFKPGALIKQFKNEIWRLIATDIDESAPVLPDIETDIERYNYDWYWKDFFDAYQEKVLQRAHDQIKILCSAQTENWLKNLIFEQDYHVTITMLECMFRTKNIPEKLATGIEECFNELSAYFVDRSSNPVRVIPAASKEAKDSAKKSLDNINESPLEVAKNHLDKAAQELNNKDFPASVRESIQAVEAATLQIYSKPSGQFGDAMKYLEKKGLLKHPTWNEILIKLYAYAGDRKNVRHSGPKPKNADVDFNEAILVYGVCVSFVDYLASQAAVLKNQ